MKRAKLARVKLTRAKEKRAKLARNLLIIPEDYHNLKTDKCYFDNCSTL